MRLVATATLACLALAACGQPSQTSNMAAGEVAQSSAPTSTPAPSPVTNVASPVPVGTAESDGSCAAEIGAEAARRLVEQCRNVSPATHPPCNTANSCADIRSEIQRSCALFDAADRPAVCDQPTAPTPESVVQLYYALLDGRNYGPAYRLWDDDGRASHQTRQAFEAGFAHTLTTTVSTGKASEPEGAAGSSYVTVPVTIEAVRDDRTRQRFIGSYVVRRSNVEPGGEWRLYSAKLKADLPLKQGRSALIDMNVSKEPTHGQASPSSRHQRPARLAHRL